MHCYRNTSQEVKCLFMSIQQCTIEYGNGVINCATVSGDTTTGCPHIHDALRIKCKFRQVD